MSVVQLHRGCTAWVRGPALGSPDVLNSTGGEVAARTIFNEATRGGIPYTGPYRGEGYMVDGRFVGFRYNDKQIPTIDYGPASNADPFRVHFP